MYLSFRQGVVLLGQSVGERDEVVAIKQTIDQQPSATQTYVSLCRLARYPRGVFFVCFFPTIVWPAGRPHLRACSSHHHHHRVQWRFDHLPALAAGEGDQNRGGGQDLGHRREAPGRLSGGTVAPHSDPCAGPHPRRSARSPIYLSIYLSNLYISDLPFRHLGVQNAGRSCRCGATRLASGRC